MDRIEQLTSACAQLGEGPVWDAASRRLWWVDLLAGDILSLHLTTGAMTRQHVGDVASAVRLRRRGGLVVAVERGFVLFDADFTGPRPVAEVFSDRALRMNDGGCDPQGRFYCGSMAYDHATGRGSLYRLDPDGSVRTVLTDVTVSNGIAWSPDGLLVYYVDSPTQRIDVFDFQADTGEFSSRRTAVTIDPAHGTPDGLTVDAEGGIWVALWDGGAVHRYDRDGRLDAVVSLPVPRVTACAFGGDDLDELFITTARVGVADTEQGQSGAVFRHRPGVRGLTAHEFAG